MSKHDKMREEERIKIQRLEAENFKKDVDSLFQKLPQDLQRTDMKNFCSEIIKQINKKDGLARII